MARSRGLGDVYKRQVFCGWHKKTSGSGIVWWTS
jgi:hypothetical protein